MSETRDPFHFICPHCRYPRSVQFPEHWKGVWAKLRCDNCNGTFEAYVKATYEFLARSVETVEAPPFDREGTCELCLSIVSSRGKDHPHPCCARCGHRVRTLDEHLAMGTIGSGRKRKRGGK